eukprot:COSAG04_NODE_652_length_11552_cov_10.246136_5_plen_184_part_00
MYYAYSAISFAQNALSPETVAELKAGADKYGPDLHSQHTPLPGEPPREASYTRPDGTLPPVLSGFWSQAYFDLLDCPPISPLLDDIYAGDAHIAPSPPQDQAEAGFPRFRIDHINVHCHGAFNKDLAGGGLHGGNGRLLEPERPKELVTHYFETDSQQRWCNGLVTVAFELEDTVCNGGGFCW